MKTVSIMALVAALFASSDVYADGAKVTTLMRQPLPDTPYCVVLSRAETRPITDVWPIGLRQPLLTVPVPLLPGDADV